MDEGLEGIDSEGESKVSEGGVFEFIGKGEELEGTDLGGKVSEGGKFEDGGFGTIGSKRGGLEVADACGDCDVIDLEQEFDVGIIELFEGEDFEEMLGRTLSKERFKIESGCLQKLSTAFKLFHLIRKKYLKSVFF